MTTSMFISNKVEQKDYSFSTAYNDLFSYLRSQELTVSEENKTFTYKRTVFEFNLDRLFRINCYALVFRPASTSQWMKSSEVLEIKEKLKELLDFLPKSIKSGNLSYTRVDNCEMINFGEWKIKFTERDGNFTVNELSNNISTINEIYGKNLKLKPVYFIEPNLENTGDIIGETSKLFADQQEIKSCFLREVKQKIEMRHDKESIFVFVLHSNSTEYSTVKKYLILNGIPSQFIKVGDKNFSFKKNNLTAEIIKKVKRRDLFSFLTNVSKVDGYICLSDIYSTNGPLFGINIIYNTEGNFTNTLKIYTDVGYTKKKSTLHFEDIAVQDLVNKIVDLSHLQSKKINIYLTKYWKNDTVKLLVNKLKESKIEVKKVFFISFFSDRFVFMEQGNNIMNNLYFIQDECIGYLQPSSKITLYGTLFPLKIELINKWDGSKLLKSDIEEMLWLIKKRLYRFSHVPSLRLPEFFLFLKRIKELGIDKEVFKYSLEADLLI